MILLTSTRSSKASRPSTKMFSVGGLQDSHQQPEKAWFFPAAVLDPSSPQICPAGTEKKRFHSRRPFSPKVLVTPLIRNELRVGFDFVGFVHLAHQPTILIEPPRTIAGFNLVQSGGPCKPETVSGHSGGKERSRRRLAEIADPAGKFRSAARGVDEREQDVEAIDRRRIFAAEDQARSSAATSVRPASCAHNHGEGEGEEVQQPHRARGCSGRPERSASTMGLRHEDSQAMAKSKGHLRDGFGRAMAA